MSMHDSQHPHVSDQDLLLAADGELSPVRSEQVASHMAECWTCRVRKGEIEGTIHDFVRVYHGKLDPLLPSAAGPRAQLKAQLAERAGTPVGVFQFPGLRYSGAVVVAILLALIVYSRPGLIPAAFESRRAFHVVPVSFPEPSLTPGATLAVSRDQVCRSVRSKNRIVPASLQRKVFEEYGISGAEPRAYEVDYLITPALGGADDIRNLWPQSYSSAVWNANVKDALEDRLRDLVCEGRLDLATAQRDISSDWIAAYKKYFQTDKPLER